MIALTFAGIEKATIIQDNPHQNLINHNGMKTLDRITKHPSLTNFLLHAKEFAKDSKLMTSQHSRIINAFLKENVIGAAVNMIGDAVHIALFDEQIPKMIKLAQKFAKPHQILISPLSFSPSHLI